MRRYALAALAALFMFTATAAPTSAHSDPNYTGVEDIVGNGSTVIERGGRYYMAAVSHRGGYLGQQTYAYRPDPDRYVGVLAYKSTFTNDTYRQGDYALIDMGTTPHSPRVKVSNDYYFYTPGGKFVYGTTQTTPAPTGADWPWGTELCFTAWPNDGGTGSRVDVRCGYADNAVAGADRCNAPIPLCGIRSPDGKPMVQSGHSGGLVWQPRPYGQVRPIGLLSNCVGAIPCASALFRPFYGWTRYNWSSAETLAGYPTGPGGRVVTG